ncbi:diaminohydroxyphosphoribosylaminopyrimidine deaminase, partial [Haematococcus lacustris]
DWNSGSSLWENPYSYSKTMAERRAHQLAAKASHWDLAALGVVDVRDLAAAHCLAAFTPAAKGSHTCRWRLPAPSTHGVGAAAV